MYHKIREAQQGDREEGFTLIELLVVVIIIGILAAIAIPVFLNQRQKARNAAANSDLRNMITAQEAYYTDHDDYAGEAEITSAATLANDGAGNLGTSGYTNSSEVKACTDADNSVDAFFAATAHVNGSQYYYYESNVGEIKNVPLADWPVTADVTLDDCEPAV